MTFSTLFTICFTFILSYHLTRRLCSPDSKLYLLDRPNERSLHASPTPRTGGIAITTSFACGFLLYMTANVIIQSSLSPLRQVPLSYVAPGLVLGAVSFWDDRAGVPAGLRLFLHCLIAATAVLSNSLQLSSTNPLWNGVLSGRIGMFLGVIFLVWMINLYNFMDGMDGFAGGMTTIGCSFVGVIAWRGGDHSLALICFLMAASAFGFLISNLPPARIFMGDVGSTVIGFLVGVCALAGTRKGIYDLYVPVLIFSPFIVDATVTLVRRTLRGERVWQAHRSHFYQRLVLAGWGHRKTVIVEYLLMLACGFSGILYTSASPEWRVLLIVGWVMLYVFLACAVAVIEQRTKFERSRSPF